MSAVYPPATWRLLRTPFSDGPRNMAIDEAILLANKPGAGGTPTLRFFGWAPPCLSLGYAQPSSDADRARLAARGWGLVRRPTGGRAILHTDELTYSVIAPMDEPRVVGGVIESYQRLSAGLTQGLQRLGLSARADQQYSAAEQGPAKGPVCFEVPSNYEITVGLGEHPRKLLGSAQVRRHGVVLQHGTLPLGGDITRIVEALAFADEAARRTAAARVAQRAATLGEVLGREVTWGEAAAAMAAGFSAALNLTLVPGPLTPAEAAAAEQLYTEKYSTTAWNERVP
ncbi:MAG: lipoate--protein ligase family protein [Anaerolineales bacterium]|nr:lipoate--protein ligase family protein [Anaerolineales bacterium]